MRVQAFQQVAGFCLDDIGNRRIPDLDSGDCVAIRDRLSLRNKNSLEVMTVGKWGKQVQVWQVVKCQVILAGPEIYSRFKNLKNSITITVTYKQLRDSEVHSGGLSGRPAPYIGALDGGAADDCPGCTTTVRTQGLGGYKGGSPPSQ
jgi:hypothetical protein